MTRQFTGGFSGEESLDFGETRGELALIDEQRKLADAEIRERTSLLDLSTDAQYLTSALARVDERSGSNFDTDVEFSVDEEKLDQTGLDQGGALSNTDKKSLLTARSQIHYDSILANISDDKKRQRELQAYGWAGTAGQIGAAIFDPAGWALAIGTGGIGGATKLGMIGRAIKGGLITGAEATAFEAVIIASDTQREMDELIIAAGTGFLIGGGLSAAFGRTPLSNASDDLNATLKLEADAEMTARVNNTVEANPSLKRVDLPDPEPVMINVGNKNRGLVLDWNSASRGVDTHRAGLHKLIGGATTGIRRGRLKAKVRELKAKGLKLTDEWTLERAALAAKQGAARSEMEDSVFDYRFGVVADKYTPELDVLSKQLDEAEEVLDRAVNAKQYQKELDDFDAMSRPEKLRTVYPEGAPKLQETVNSSRVGMLKFLKPIQRKPVEEATEDLAPTGFGEGTAGAAQVEGAVIESHIFSRGETAEEFVSHLHDISETLPQTRAFKLSALGKGFTDRFQGLSTTFDNSQNPVFRALGSILFENTQGTKNAVDTVGGDLYLDQNRISGALRNRYNEGWEEYMDELGVGTVAKVLDVANRRRTFDESVYKKIVTGEDASPAITKAAEGLQDGFKKALELRKLNGEHGFKHVKADSRYVPRIISGAAISKAASGTGGKKAVIDALTKGYQTGGVKVSEKTAKLLAEIQYERSIGSMLSGDTIYRNVVSKKDQGAFIKELEDAGIDPTAIEDFLSKTAVREMDNNMSNRAKMSFFINPMAESNGVKVMDLLNTDLAQLSDSYFREAAGGSAMAKHGFASQAQAQDVIKAAEEWGGANGLDKARLKQEGQMLRDAIKMAYGRSLDDDPSSSGKAFLRRAREYTGMIRLQQNGFAQFGEAARMLAEFGLKDVLANIPNTAFFKRKSVRAGGKHSGELDEPVLRELERAGGYIGEDSLLPTSHTTRADDFGEETKLGLSRILDNALSAGTKVTRILSGFQAVQGGMEKMVMRMTSKRLVDMLEGNRAFAFDEMARVGWDRPFIDQLQEFFNSKPMTDKFGGKDIRILNLEGMSPQMRDKVLVGMNRIKGRLVQRSFLGDESPFMNTWLGKTLTQFRSFSIISLEKQLVHDLRGNHLKSAQILAWSSLIGLIAYSTQMHIQALGKEDPDKFLDKVMSSRSVAFGVFNKMPQTASVSLGGDFLATLGALPEDMMASAKGGGFRAMNAEGVPVLGTAGDVISLAPKVIDLLSGDAEGADVANSARKLIPLMNVIGVGQILEGGINATR